MNTYIKKDGTISKYKYKYKKEYNKTRNKKIYNLQKLKSYYKKIGNIKKVNDINILINNEKIRTEDQKHDRINKK